MQICFAGCDDEGWYFVNGQFVGESHDWQAQPIFDIKKFLHAGDNVIAVGVNNGVGQGGLNPNVNVRIIGHASAPPWSRSLFNGLAQIIVQSTRRRRRNQADRNGRRSCAGNGSGANTTLHAAPVRAVKLRTFSKRVGCICVVSHVLGVMLFLFALAAQASDDMLIYSDRFNNGWGDNWSWMPRYTTNNPVYTGSNAMACVPSGQWQAWWLKSGTSVDTTIYTNVSFWLNGGATGGQSISVSGELDGSGLPGVSVTAPTNSWKQVTISLASLGINKKTNLTGFQFGNGTSMQPFFIDGLRLAAAPAPPAVHVSVFASQTVRKVNGNVFGINQVAWDGNVNTSATAAVLNDIGATCMRWPGGSWGDGYHWTNEAWSAGATSPRTWGSFSPDFIALATNTHSDAFIIVNYGTSTPEEAAYGVRMFNVTNHCNFKYWEVGNEVGGSWEWDWNTNAPFKAHDPWTYALRFTNYYAQMKAADPTIKIGAVADIYEDGTVNNYDHPVVNPRTGVTSLRLDPGDAVLFAQQ